MALRVPCSPCASVGQIGGWESDVVYVALSSATVGKGQLSKVFTLAGLHWLSTLVIVRSTSPTTPNSRSSTAKEGTDNESSACWLHSDNSKSILDAYIHRVLTFIGAFYYPTHVTLQTLAEIEPMVTRLLRMLHLAIIYIPSYAHIID